MTTPTTTPHPLADIIQFCDIYNLPYTPPTQLPEDPVERLELASQTHAWLQDQCHQYGITYPWNPTNPNAFDEYGELLRIRWAAQRAAHEHELNTIADALTNPTGQYRHQQESPPSPNTDAQTTTSLPTTKIPSPVSGGVDRDSEGAGGEGDGEDASMLKHPPTQIQNDAQASKKHPRCEHHKASGRRCKRYPMHGDSFCYQHSPATASEAQHGSAQGGRTNRGTLTALEIPIELANSGGVAATLAIVARLFASGSLSHRQVLSFTRILNLAVLNVRAHPRRDDYIFHAGKLRGVLGGIETNFQVADVHERQDEIAAHRQRANATAEIAAEHNTKPRFNLPTK